MTEVAQGVARGPSTSSTDLQGDDELDHGRRLFALANLVTPWAIRTAASLRLADEVARGRTRAEDLAAHCGVQPTCLYRLMRFLCSQGIFIEVEPATFELTPMAQLLRSDLEESFHPYLVSPLEARFSLLPAHMIDALRTGRPPFEDLFGESVFEFLARDPQAKGAFEAGMSENVSRFAPLVMAAYDWGAVRHVVDVGGSRGRLLSALLTAWPQMRGTLFDLAHVVEGAQAILGDGLADRSRIVAGNMFEGVPGGGDRYVLSHILHDWDDSRATTILSRCREAVSDDSRLIILERVVPEGNEDHLSKHADMRLFLMFGGLERTEREFAQLLAGAGFRLETIIPTGDPVSIIEAVPV